MEKLYDLLLKYEEEIKKSEWDNRYYFSLSYNKQYIECINANDWQFLTTYEFRIIICSKWYGFIQRLVENDKIDFEWLEKELLKIWIYKNVWYYEWLLMLLSIQDNPIEFLVSILK